MFSGGMKSMSHLEQLEWFLGNPYWMFAGAIVCTLLWQSSSLTTTAVIGLVASGALPLPSAIAAILGANVGTTGTIWIAGMLVSDGLPRRNNETGGSCAYRSECCYGSCFTSLYSTYCEIYFSLLINIDIRGYSFKYFT